MKIFRNALTCRSLPINSTKSSQTFERGQLVWNESPGNFSGKSKFLYFQNASLAAEIFFGGGGGVRWNENTWQGSVGLEMFEVWVYLVRLFSLQESPENSISVATETKSEVLAECMESRMLGKWTRPARPRALLYSDSRKSRPMSN